MYSRDIVHIHPSACSSEPRFIYMPAGLFSMMNEVAAAHHEVLVVNDALEMLMDKSASAEQIVADNPADVYSIDIHWHEHLGRGIELANLVKRIRPASTVVVGGLTASCFAEQILENHHSVDIVVKGDGEGVLRRIIETKRDRRPQGLIRGAENVDMDALDHIGRKWLLHGEQYTRCSLHGWMQYGSIFWLKTGDGCPFDCSFCGGSKSSQRRIFGRHQVRRRDPALLGCEIVRLFLQKIDRVGLTQDPSSASEDYWRAMHRAVRSKSLRPGVYIEAGGVPSKAFLDDFGDTFDTQKSYIALWPISPNPQVRNKHGKEYDDRRLNECLQAGARRGIRFILFFSRHVDFLEESSLAERQESIDRWREAYPGITIFDTFLTLDPFAPAAMTPASFGIDPSLRNYDDYLSRCQQRSMQLPNYNKLGYALCKNETAIN